MVATVAPSHIAMKLNIKSIMNDFDFKLVIIALKTPKGFSSGGCSSGRSLKKKAGIAQLTIIAMAMKSIAICHGTGLGLTNLGEASSKSISGIIRVAMLGTRLTKNPTICTFIRSLGLIVI